MEHDRRKRSLSLLAIPALLLALQDVGAADLMSLYQQAKESDPVIRSARANRDANREGEPIARSQLLPNVTARGDASYTNRDTDAPGFDNSFNSAAGSVVLTQAIYQPGRTATYEQAQLITRQAEANYMVAEQSLIQRVANAYFDVLAAQDNVRFVQADIKAIARQLDQAKQRFEVGLIAITGVYEAQARFDQARADEILAINRLDNAREALREIAGVWEGDLADLPEEIKLELPDPQDPERWNEIALENSPEVASSREAVEVARKEIDIQRAGRLPTLDAVASYTLDRTDSDTDFDADTGVVGLQLAVPLYTGGGVEASMRQATYALEAAQEDLEGSRRSVSRRVQDSYTAVQASVSRVRALQASSVSANSALEATNAGYEVGTRTLVDVLDAQRDLFRSQRDHAQARYDYVLARLLLRQVAGVLTEEDLSYINQRLEKQ